MKFAFADPPYLGTSTFGAAHHYGDLHPDAADFDHPAAHAALICRLCDEFEAWALSLSSPSLRTILPMCPPDVRVGAWVKPFCSFKPGVNPAYAWEPVIFRGGRKRERREPKIRDFASVGITLRAGFPGAKPEAFCWWVFDLLNALPGDDFHDLFPGSGAVGLAWRSYCRIRRGFPLFDPDAVPDGVPS